MRSLSVVAACVAASAALGAAACKDKPKDPPPAAKPSREAPPAPPGPARADEPPPRAGPPLPPPAEPPAAAPDERCHDAGATIGPALGELLAGVAVPEGQRDAAAAELGKAFGALCATADWPTTAVDCLLRNKMELFTLDRCLDRLPSAARRAWDERLADAIRAAGGTPVELPPGVNAAGVPFEEVCPTFVAEMARVEACAGMSYSPTLEQVYTQRRAVEIGGLIPPEAIDDLRELCARRAESARMFAAQMCPTQDL